MKNTLITIAVLAGQSLLGQISNLLIKLGSQQTKLVFENKNIGLTLNIYTALGLFLYLISFFVTMNLLRKYNLSYFLPMSTAVGHVIMLVMSVNVLHEQVNRYQLIGIAVILIGVFVMNINQGVK